MNTKDILDKLYELLLNEYDIEKRRQLIETIRIGEDIRIQDAKLEILNKVK